MRISQATPNPLSRLVFAAVAALGLAGFTATGAAAQEQETYDWSAVLMSFDEANHTAVMQARFEGRVDVEPFGRFEEGERLTLVWTGRRWAAGIRDLGPDPDVSAEALTLPVEFVSTAREGRYLNFRVQVPEDSVETLAALDIGARVTGISPKGRKDFADAILTLREYNDIS